MSYNTRDRESRNQGIRLVNRFTRSIACRVHAIRAYSSIRILTGIN